MAMVYLSSLARLDAGNTNPSQSNPRALGGNATRPAFTAFRLNAFAVNLDNSPAYADFGTEIARSLRVPVGTARARDPGRALVHGPAAPPFCYSTSTTELHLLARHVRRD